MALHRGSLFIFVVSFSAVGISAYAQDNTCTNPEPIQVCPSGPGSCTTQMVCGVSSAFNLPANAGGSSPDSMQFMPTVDSSVSLAQSSFSAALSGCPASSSDTDVQSANAKLLATQTNMTIADTEFITAKTAVAAATADVASSQSATAALGTAISSQDTMMDGKVLGVAGAAHASIFAKAKTDITPCQSSAGLSATSLATVQSDLSGLLASLAPVPSTATPSICYTAIDNLLTSLTAAQSDLASLGPKCQEDQEAFAQLEKNSGAGTLFAGYSSDESASTPMPTVSAVHSVEIGEMGLNPGAGRALASGAVAAPGASSGGRALASVSYGAGLVSSTQKPMSLMSLEAGTSSSAPASQESSGVSVAARLQETSIVNGLEMENSQTGRSLSGFERLTRRLCGTGGLRCEMLSSAEAQRKQAMGTLRVTKKSIASKRAGQAKAK